MVKELNYHIRTEKKMTDNIRSIIEIAEDVKTKPMLYVSE